MEAEKEKSPENIWGFFYVGTEGKKSRDHFD